MTDKPPYRIPTMQEVRAIPWNGYTVASTFAGCGGSSTGYRMAGYRVLYANERYDKALDSYRANAAPYTFVDDRDIRVVKSGEILEACELTVGELDLFDGSPPCDSFSTAGARDRGWGKVKSYSGSVQRTDDLTWEFIRLLTEMQPRTFIVENVSGLLKGKAKGYFIEMMRSLKAAGYAVACRLLDTRWLDVAQARQRTIFIGVRNDLANRYQIAPIHPRPLSYNYTMRDAFRHLIDDDSEQLRIIHDTFNNVGDVTDRPSPTVTQRSNEHYLTGSTVTHDPETGQDLRFATQPGMRKLTLQELRAICGFPPDFVLTGTYQHRWNRLGLAVPPMMMNHVAQTVRDEILAKCRA